MRRRVLFVRASVLTVALACATLAGYPSPAQAQDIVPSVPPISSKSYFLMDADTSKVLAERDSDMPLPPASLTKIMTGYVAAAEIAAGRVALDDEVPISVEAWRTGGSKTFVREGTSVRLEDLLRGIVIQSGNDASIAVAEYIGGDEDGFASMMNAHADALGLGNTEFVNSTGLPDDGHYASARDLAVLSKALIERYPEHYAMYSERSFKYGDIEQPNRNRLLWRDKSVDGVKTGLTDAAGYCLVASAKRDGMRLIAVVLGADTGRQRFADAQKLLSYGFRYFESRTLYEGGEVLATREVWYGTSEAVDLALTDPLRITLPRGRFDELDAVIDLPREVEAPFEQNDALGHLRVDLAGEPLIEVPLVANSTVPESNLLSRIGDGVYLLFRNLATEDDGPEPLARPPGVAAGGASVDESPAGDAAGEGQAELGSGSQARK